jgi:hypothetical protein
MKRLLKVEDTFAITGRGLMIAPLPALHEVRGPGDFEVELRLPDGARRAARLTVVEPFVLPASAVQRWSCLFADLGKADVPIGTEVWCGDDVSMRSLPILR